MLRGALAPWVGLTVHLDLVVVTHAGSAAWLDRRNIGGAARGGAPTKRCSCWGMAPREALVVDDDADSRGVLAQLLQAHGYTVREAENGRIALDMIAERLPGILLLDLEMPVMSGWEVLASLQRTRARKAIAVVVLSAGAAPPLGVAFLRKPCGIDELLGMLGTVDDPHESSSRTGL